MTRARELLLWLGLHPTAFRDAADWVDQAIHDTDEPATRARTILEAAATITIVAVLAAALLVVTA